MGHPAVPEPMSKKSMRVVSVFAFQVIDSPACCIGGHEDCRTRIGAHASVVAGTRHQVLSSRAKLPIAKRSATESKDPFSVWCCRVERQGVRTVPLRHWWKCHAAVSHVGILRLRNCFAIAKQLLRSG